MKQVWSQNLSKYLPKVALRRELYEPQLKKKQFKKPQTLLLWN